MPPQILRTPAEMAAWSEAARARGLRIAFVPTMGALHAGHVALLEAGRQRGDRLVLSIFVNPTQFGPKEDLASYPRDLDSDLAKAGVVGVDVAFVPEPATMYPAGFQTYVQVRDIEQGLCGDRRPGHFVGVATVVLKLFNIVRPQVALFGEKDFQQLAVIRRMVRDLDLPIEVAGHPTVRAPDGLALSSRNAYLSLADRARAPALGQALLAARDRCLAGEVRAAVLIDAATLHLASAVDRVDYIEIRDSDTLAPVDVVDRPAVMLAAAFLGRTRLIDNVRLR